MIFFLVFVEHIAFLFFQKNRRDITLFRINPDKEEHIIQGGRFLLEKNIGEEVKTLVIGQ